MRTAREAFLFALQRAWSLDSSTRWTPGNPARGQCGVTSLVANDHLGGRILKTPVENGTAWHFYNELDGERVDFTAAQFDEPLDYLDAPSNREEALADTNEGQYRALSRRLPVASG